MWKNDAPNATPAGEFADGPAPPGMPETAVGSKWLNTIQRELVRLVEGAGLTLDPNDFSQVLQAVARIAARANSGDIQPQGPVNDDHLVAWLGTSGLLVKDSGRRVADLALAPWRRQRHLLIAAPGEPGYRVSGWTTPPIGSMFARAELRPEGAFVAYTSENVVPNEVAGLETPHYRYVRPAWSPTLAGTFRTPTDLSQTRLWLGFVSGHIGQRTTPSGRAVAALRFEHGVDPGWATVTCGGGAGVTVVQAQPQWAFAANSVYRWRIEITAGGPVSFYVNEIPASQTHTTDLPVGQAWLGCVSQMVTKGHHARNCGVSSLVLEHD